MNALNDAIRERVDRVYHLSADETDQAKTNAELQYGPEGEEGNIPDIAIKNLLQVFDSLYDLIIREEQVVFVTACLDLVALFKGRNLSKERKNSLAVSPHIFIHPEVQVIDNIE